MKKILTLAVLMLAALSLQAQDDPYKEEMDILDAQGEAIMKQYQVLKQADPNGEQAVTRVRVAHLAQMLDSISNEQLLLVKRIIRENKQNHIPVSYIKEAMYDLGYEGLKEALDPKAVYYSDPALDRPKALLAGYEKRAPGKTFHELLMQDMDGKDVTLSQWVGRGNYVLVDFWASWCGPCRMEMPNVLACYERYHDKGFEVVGVSFDKQKNAWQAAVKQLGLRWPQMSDLKGWQCAAAGLYGVSSIPSNVLVDPKGVIVAMDLRGKALGDKLREIYGE